MSEIIMVLVLTTLIGLGIMTVREELNYRK